MAAAQQLARRRHGCRAWAPGNHSLHAALCPAGRPPQAPFERRREVGRLRLLRLLQRIMIRASKRELLNLGIPPLLYTASRELNG